MRRQLDDFDTPAGHPARRQFAAERLARQHLAEHGYDGPTLHISTEQLARNARRFIAALPGVQPHFAVKANPHPQVLQTLAREGVGFEIASRAELEALLALGADPAELYYSNPIKASDHIARARDAGVRWLVVDSVAEVEKIAAIHPDAALYLRLATSNAGAVWPLAGKFGATGTEIEAILRRCGELQLDLGGVSFHVGSQCLTAQSWVEAIGQARALMARMAQRGFRPRLLNLGGGYPTDIDDAVPGIESIGAAIAAALDELPAGVHVIAEPGRNLVASAGCLSTRVVGTALRAGQPWLYLDCGYYNGLMELADRYPLPIHAPRGGEQRLWTLAGPTCDSIDTLSRQRALPSDLRADDILHIGHTGAYCHGCTTRFNGFDEPAVRVH